MNLLIQYGPTAAFLLAGWSSAFNVWRALKLGRFWDSFFKHHYSRERHPVYFWSYIGLQVVAVVGWCLIALFWFLNLNPFFGQPLRRVSASSNQNSATGGQKMAVGLTLRCTRTPPALPFVLSQHPASSASFSASVQAWPVSFIR